jgi:pyruvate kinase
MQGRTAKVVSEGRRVKIVCTMGPAVSSPEKMRAIVDAGMDVARLNLSHGDYSEHEERYRLVRQCAAEAGRTVAVLVDLQGPKIRLGRFAEGSVVLVAGEPFTITVDDIAGDVHRCSTTHKGLPNDAKPGDHILVDDGRLTLRVTSVTATDVNTVVVLGGRVSNNKGLNLPSATLSVPAMSEKDLEDLRWGLQIGADLIAVSFVQRPEDVDAVHRVMDQLDIHLPVIAKIEKPQAVEKLEAIIDAFDGIMVARGDLGVELPLEDVPIVQKRAVMMAREAGKPVIVATQMLESMISAPRPTRAEASDVANAVLDGADAVMLSGETSVGEYPVETVSTMARIVVATEAASITQIPRLVGRPTTIGNAIGRAATLTGQTLGAKFLVAFSSSGDTVRGLARHRCVIPLLAFTPYEAVQRQLALSWGTESFTVPMVEHTDEMVLQVDKALLSIGRCEPGDLVAIVFGSPVGRTGMTNTLRMHRIGEEVSA